MVRVLGLALAAAMLPGVAVAGEAGDALVQHLYAGTSAEGLSSAVSACEAGDSEACFAEAMYSLVLAYEGLAEDLYRYGASTPSMPAAAMLLGLGMGGEIVEPANSAPEPLSYDKLRQMLEDFLADLDTTRAAFIRAGESGDFMVRIDPLKVRIDFDGDGEAGADETLGTLLTSAGVFMDNFDGEMSEKTKTKVAELDTSVGFDRADAFWFAGYSQIAGAPLDFLLAHDFSGFYDAYLHRVFPASGLPMQDYSRGGTLMMDPESDAAIADIIAAIHTLSFPVVDAERLSGVRGRLLEITALSRRNWDAILAETDDERELVPSPAQTSIFPGHEVTEDVVSAWMATLDTLDTILEGELLLPHWRFSQGFDLKAFFETATRTDLVIIFTGQGAVPFLADGPVADAQSFAEGNRVFGDAWPNFVLWFN
ncbi:hypothetical protein [Devosia sp. SD17-2]|uniref:hypothetical protein n=1 Tax=Devosia sp. SD17-2 TaxID=2976459 RepID=UPI0023D858DD|nr:hypothetical protein [Devosia sp. SD17-2]WEJ34716.1 hypothetical protein NYQ88_07930 [Devosia sp. SD17-2]